MERRCQSWGVSLPTSIYRANQYILRVVKCEDEECCSASKSSLRTEALKDSFFLAPMSLVKVSTFVAQSVLRHNLSPNLFQRLPMNYANMSRLVDKQGTRLWSLLSYSKYSFWKKKMQHVQLVLSISLHRIHPIRVVHNMFTIGSETAWMTITASGEREIDAWLE